MEVPDRGTGRGWGSPEDFRLCPGLDRPEHAPASVPDSPSDYPYCRQRSVFYADGPYLRKTLVYNLLEKSLVGNTVRISQSSQGDVPPYLSST